jgi:hypothetical protein
MVEFRGASSYRDLPLYHRPRVRRLLVIISSLYLMSPGSDTSSSQCRLVLCRLSSSIPSCFFSSLFLFVWRDSMNSRSRSPHMRSAKLPLFQPYTPKPIFLDRWNAYDIYHSTHGRDKSGPYGGRRKCGPYTWRDDAGRGPIYRARAACPIYGGRRPLFACP